MPSLPSETANCLTRSPVADTIFFRFFQVSFPASLYYFRDVRSHGQFQQLDQPARVCEKYHPGRRNPPLIKHLGFINLHLEISSLLQYAGRPRRQGTGLVRSIANHDAPTPRDPW